MGDKNHAAPLSDVQVRVKALESLLLEKQFVTQQALDTVVDNYENRVGPHLGAKLVARAWVDDDFRQRLLADSPAVIAEMGLAGIEGTHVEVKENTDRVHNMVVCTLCSCYPWSLLGLPPTWYKSSPYRSRSVKDPRGVLKEFGVELGEDVEIRVWDSNAEIRYLVLPMRPAGTETLDEDQLAQLVTRDSMIGTGVCAA